MSQVTLPDIGPLDATAMAAVRARLASLTKPAGSLGKIEELAVWLAGIQGRAQPSVDRRTIVVAAADHGVAERGVSAYPSEVTVQMVANFLAGGAAINVLARQAGAHVLVVDAGIRELLDPHDSLVSMRIAGGTRDMTTGPAMSEEHAVRCLEAGINLAERIEADVIGCGEMGIGNTTSASAIVAAQLGESVAKVTGRGTGLDRAGVQRKIRVIEEALRLNEPTAGDALDVLAKVGGFEIGVLAGLMIGAASQRKAVLVDGFISSAAAMLAVTLSPACRDYLLASHLSTEPGHRLALFHLRLDPLLDLRLRLGEGTGAALAIPVLDSACRIISEMATFDEAGVSGSLQKPRE